jgi:3-oxoacyl-[acyl-carrier protein] reductase
MDRAMGPLQSSRVKAMQCIDADGSESDVVDTMLFLTSDHARFITGETLRVTGGMAAGG